jgi:hypothetical protein
MAATARKSSWIAWWLRLLHVGTHREAPALPLGDEHIYFAPF